MDLFDRIMSDAESRIFDTSAVDAEIAADEQRTARKQKLLHDPQQLETLVANAVLPYYPKTKKIKTEKYNTKTDAIEAAIGEDHPLSGLATTVKAKTLENLLRPELSSLEPEEIAAGVRDAALNMPTQDKSTILEKAYKHKRAEDADLKFTRPLDTIGSLLGIGSREDKTLARLPGYDQWLEQTRAQEDVEDTKRNKLGELVQNVGVVGSVGAAIGGAAGGPVGAAAVGGIGALAELAYFPFREALSSTEWYRGQRHSNNALDKFQVLVTKYGPEIFIGGAAEAKFARGIIETAKLAKMPGRVARYEKIPGDRIARITSEKGHDIEATVVNEEMREYFGPLAKKREKMQVLPEDAMHTMEKEFQATGRFVLVGEGVEQPFMSRLPKRSPWPDTNLPVPQMKLPFDFTILKGTPSAPLKELGAVPNIATRMEAAAPKLFARLKDPELVNQALSDSDGIVVGTFRAYNKQVAARLYTDPEYAERYMRKTLEVARREVSTYDYEGAGKSLVEYARTRTGGAATAPIEVVDSPAMALAKEEFAKVPSFTTWDDVMQTTVTRNYADIAGSKEAMRRITQVAVGTDRESVKAIKMKVVEVGDKEVRAIVSGDAKALNPDVLNYDAVVGSKASVARDRIKNIVLGLAMFGVTPAVLTAFDPNNGRAEAGMLSNIVGGLATGAKRAVTAMTDFDPALKGLGLRAKELADDATMLGPEHIFKGLNPDKELGGAEYFARNLRDVVKGKSKQGTIYNTMTPMQIIETAIRTEAGKMVNPAVLKASFYSAEIHNIARLSLVTNNILQEAGIASDLQLVKKLYSPLVDMALQTGQHDVLTLRAKKLETLLSRLGKKSKTARRVGRAEVYKEELTAVQEQLGQLSGVVEKYHAAHMKVSEAAARQSASVRVSLALENLESGELRYPFLDGMLTANEKAAVGKLRASVLDIDKQRLRDLYPRRKKVVIEEGYLPHILPDEMISKKFQEMPGANISAANMKFYRRTMNSRPLMPDIHNTMATYIRQTERRIQNVDFWGKGTGREHTWYKVMNSGYVRGNAALETAFKRLYHGADPVEWTPLNKMAETYSMIEVVKRLFLMPSSGFRHLLKVTGSIVQHGGLVVASHAPTSIRSAFSQTLSTPLVRKTLGRLGVHGSTQQRFINDFINSFSPANNLHRQMLDAGIEVPEQVLDIGHKLLRKTANAGGVFINLFESFDRGVSVTAAITRAAGKKGWTAEQAAYGIYDTILRNNFLSREFGSKWMRTPWLRSLFLFQATAFKVFERRAVMAYRTGNVLFGEGRLWQQTMERIKSGEGMQVVKELAAVRKYIKNGERLLRSNMVVDALDKEVDFFGTPVVHQFMKEVLTVGSGTVAGLSAGMHLWGHFMHVPFLSPIEDKPALATNPLVQAAYAEYHRKDEEDDEFLPTRIFQKWAGRSGPFPDIVGKMIRASEDDVPTIYGEDSLKYLRYFLATKSTHEE